MTRIDFLRLPRPSRGVNNRTAKGGELDEVKIIYCPLGLG